MMAGLPRYSASSQGTLQPHGKGLMLVLFYNTPAVITFRVPTKAALQEAYATLLLPLEILSDKPRKNPVDLRILAKYGSLVILIVVLFMYLVATPSKTGVEEALMTLINVPDNLSMVPNNSPLGN
ncbi:hypothetical protein LXL04_013556 [Taraxacum kok-saghyz]